MANVTTVPKDYDTYKIIRAFNERLRIARKQYGDDSIIVKEMIKRAKMVSELEWTKSGLNIKKGKENVEKIVTIYQKKLVIKYIKETTVESILSSMLDPTTLKDLTKTKGKDRYKKIAEKANIVAKRRELTSTIWKDIYNDGITDYDTCKLVYEGIKSGQYDEEVKKYYEGNIDLQDLAQIVQEHDGPQRKYVDEVNSLLEDFSFDDDDSEDF